jgi:hypothetical protein
LVAIRFSEQIEFEIEIGPFWIEGAEVGGLKLHAKGIPPNTLIDYISTMRLRPVVDGNITFFEWSVTFEIDPGHDGKEQTNFFTSSTYQSGFDSLKKITAYPESPSYQ